MRGRIAWRYAIKEAFSKVDTARERDQLGYMALQGVSVEDFWRGR